jgi:hypothetical protein
MTVLPPPQPAEAADLPLDVRIGVTAYGAVKIEAAHGSVALSLLIDPIDEQRFMASLTEAFEQARVQQVRNRVEATFTP